MTDDKRIDGWRREQEVADRALREFFAGRPCPDLPPFFAARCAHRATLAPAFRPLSATAKVVLRAYGVATVVVSAAMLTGIDWPARLSPVVAVGAGVSIATTVLPMLLFGRSLGGPSGPLGRAAK